MVCFGVREDCVALLRLYGGDIISSPLFRREMKYMQHGSTSTYTHSLAVAYVTVLLAKQLNLKGLDMRSAVRGALLHDYFLYDWHNRDDGSHRLHGFRHAGTACGNAIRDFGITPLEQSIILSHMYPLNITKPPRSREAWIVTAADKICAGCESLHLAAYTEQFRGSSAAAST